MQPVSTLLIVAVIAGCAATQHPARTVASTGSAMCRSDDACGPGSRCVDGQCARASVTVAPTLRAHDTPVVPRPCELVNVYFAFDSSALDPQDATVADRDASCILERGPANRRIVIVGRTDPRGSTEYNLALGERRAAALAHQLERMGIRGDQVVTQSVGSEYATGSDETGWARDRVAGFDRPQ